jgi:hypothetical protein
MSTDHPLGFVDMTNEEYHASPGISKSQLDTIGEKSEKHYWHRYLNPAREPDPPTAAMKLGSAIHVAILEPHLIDDHVVAGLDLDRRSNANKQAWAEFEEANKGKIIIPAEGYRRMLEMVDAVHSHPVASNLFVGGRAEQSVFARDIETNELIKCRYDYFHGGSRVEHAIDLKKTTDSHPIGFGKSAANYRYDVQAAWYYHVTYCAFGYVPDAWTFVSIEEEPPYAIGIHPVDEVTLHRAQIAALRDFHRIVEARRRNHFPDYGETPEVLQLPGWAKR